MGDDDEQKVPPEAIDKTKVNPYEDAESLQEKNAIETRNQRINSDILEQKHTFQGIIFNFIGVVILCLYALLVLCLYWLALSQLPFKKEFPIGGLIFLGIIAIVPTLLSAFLMTGLFSQKDVSKDDKPSLTDFHYGQNCVQKW